MSKNFLRLIFLFGILTGLGALFAYTLREAAIPYFCKDVMFSSGYASCSGDLTGTLTGFLIAISVLSVASFASIVWFEQSSRQFFLKFFKFFFIPFAVITLLIGFFVPFCIGWLGCFSLLPSMFQILVAVLACGVIAAGFKVFFLRFTVVFFIVLVAAVGWGSGVYASYLDDFKTYVYDRDFEDKARRANDISLCENTFIPGLRDRCIRSFAIQAKDGNLCNAIVSADEKEECAAFIIRNRAIDTLDTALCETITIPSQECVCKKRIGERQNRQKTE